jgi:hypothetical protein
MTATIFRAICHQCHCRLRIPSIYLHQVVRCTKCRRQFRVQPRPSGLSFSISGAGTGYQHDSHATDFSGMDIVTPQPFPKRPNWFLAAQFFGWALLSLVALALCIYYRDQLFDVKPANQPPAAPVAAAAPAKEP